MEEVATSPIAGDVVVLRSGHVRYEIKSVDCRPDGRLSAERSQVRPDHPTIYVSLQHEVWADLVRFAACSVETTT